MTDLTKITTPFGLLDTETQAALMAHGGPYEFYGIDGVWEEFPTPYWCKTATYRVKPTPPKPREWWCVGVHMHDSKDEAMAFRQRVADGYGKQHLSTPIVHVREVLP